MPVGEQGEVIARLQRAGYLDDARFARDRATVLADRGRGDEAIRHDLERRGVRGDVLERGTGALSRRKPSERGRSQARLEAASVPHGRWLATDSRATPIEAALATVAPEGERG